jgi:hypothetical protein
MTVTYTSDRSLSRGVHFLHALGSRALPIRPGDEEAAAIVAGGTTADVGKVEGVRVDELDAVIALCPAGRVVSECGLYVAYDPSLFSVGLRKFHLSD